MKYDDKREPQAQRVFALAPVFFFPVPIMLILPSILLHRPPLPVTQTAKYRGEVNEIKIPGGESNYGRIAARQVKRMHYVWWP